VRSPPLLLLPHCFGCKLARESQRACLLALVCALARWLALPVGRERERERERELLDSNLQKRLWR
jgi:hypothetical protein